MCSKNHDDESYQCELEQLRKRNMELEELVNGRIPLDQSKQEEWYLALFNNLDEGFTIIDVIFEDDITPVDLYFVAVNDIANKITGKKLEGKRLKEVDLPYESYWYELFGEVALTGKSKKIERYAGPAKKWYRDQIFKIGDENSRRIGVVLQDITEQKLISEELEKSDQMFRMILNNSRDGINLRKISTDEFLYFSPSYSEITGFSEDELRTFTGMTVFERIHPDDKETCMERLNMLTSGKITTVEHEFRWQVKNGQYRWLNYKGSLISDSDRKPDAILGIIRDITNRKNNEEELAFQAKLLSNASDSILAVDENDKIIYCNKAFEKLFGFQCEELIGRKSSKMIRNFLSLESQDKIHKLIENSLMKGADHVEELSCYNKDGNLVIIDINSSINKDENGGFKGYVLSIRDASRRVNDFIRIQESDKKAQDLIGKLRQADENKNMFIKILSHELRNPMASIKMGLSLLDMIQTDAEKSKNTIRIMERQIMQLSRLVDDLLEVERLAENKIELKVEIFDLNQLIRDVISDGKSELLDKDIELSVDLNPESIYVEADPMRMKQVIGNLIHNAKKFTDKNGQIRIKSYIDDIKSEAIISVRDNGTGIENSLLPHIFEPFIQGDDSLDRSNGGLGLGLVIVKGIVDMHGGSITAMSGGMNKGSEFVIRIPLKSNKIGSEVAEISMKELPFVPLKILVIDDNPDLLEIMVELLEYLGHEVTAALTGKEGIDEAMRCQPDVLVCDIGLPDMDGYEVAKTFRYEKALRGVYLITLSGYAQPDDMERSKLAGFNQHLAKPVELDQLRAALSESLLWTPSVRI